MFKPKREILMEIGSAILLRSEFCLLMILSMVSCLVAPRGTLLLLEELLEEIAKKLDQEGTWWW